MRQYVEQKQAVGDAVLLFRMGDFYETFFEDAVLCSKVLGIALTTRNKGSNAIPLAGIPYHALDNYLQKLVTAGYKVAISEQMEDPKQAKGVIKREVTRIVTAGTLTDETLLPEQESNLLAALCVRGSEVGVAVAELAGGRFEVFTPAPQEAVDELVRLAPAELIIDDHPGGPAEQLASALGEVRPVALSRSPVNRFAPAHAERVLLEHFAVTTLSGFGFDRMDASLCAAGAILDYLHETQKQEVAHIATLTRRVSGAFVHMDHNTWRSLEISATLRGGAREGSLLGAVDRTVHPTGARTLRRYLTYPLTDVERIIQRQDAVAMLSENHDIRDDVRRAMRMACDVERIASRVALERATPRDLKALGHTLALLPGLQRALGDHPVAFLEQITRRMDRFESMADLLERAIRDEPALTLREGGVIAPGYNAELDRLYAIGADGRAWLADYQRRQAEETGIPNLKVAYNRVFGYYIEVSKTAADKVPNHYVRRQTVKNAERYITDELKRYEDEALTAQDKAHALEFDLFQQVRAEVARHTRKLLDLAAALGELDCVAGLAELAVERRYVRPTFTTDGGLDIRDGRHPVLDQTLNEAFVPNDTVMNAGPDRVFIVTGPNMAGKSTYIRQVALLTLLAQTGSFVPAGAMVLSPVDRIFARVGAADEIMRGQSTFMVEMTEAANILRNATRASLVILDEIGRGTSTFDGLSLAWAITEHLATVIQPRCLIATHYHELTELADLIKGVRNYNVAVREVDVGPGEPTADTPPDPSADTPSAPPTARAGGDIVFLYRIVDGRADKSYGVHVARLAGIPRTVIERSCQILDELQRGFDRKSAHPRRGAKRNRNDHQLTLFPDPAEEVLRAVVALDLDHMTPIEALQKLAELHNQARGAPPR